MLWNSLREPMWECCTGTVFCVRRRCCCPRGLLSIGVVLDDLVILEKVSSQMVFVSEDRAGAKRLDAAYAAYEGCGWRTPKKANATPRRPPSGVGCEVEGNSGL